MSAQSRKSPAKPESPVTPSNEEKRAEHLNELLDEALRETFPASDAPAMLEPGPADGEREPRERGTKTGGTGASAGVESETATRNWLVKATWKADEEEASERWEVNAPSAQAAMNEVAPHLHFNPLRVEVSQQPHDPGASGLKPGEIRRIPPA